MNVNNGCNLQHRWTDWGMWSKQLGATIPCNPQTNRLAWLSKHVLRGWSYSLQATEPWSKQHMTHFANYHPSPAQKSLTKPQGCQQDLHNMNPWYDSRLFFFRAEPLSEKEVEVRESPISLIASTFLPTPIPWGIYWKHSPPDPLSCYFWWICC